MRNCPFEKRSYFYLECLAVNTRFLYIFLGIIPLLRPPLSSFVWKCFLARLYGSERARSLYGIAINPDRSLEIIRLCGLIPFPLVEILDRRLPGGQEHMAQIDYTPSRNYSAYLRYKYRQKKRMELLKMIIY